jgi:hypothetical protein
MHCAKLMCETMKSIKSYKAEAEFFCFSDEKQQAEMQRQMSEK